IAEPAGVRKVDGIYIVEADESNTPFDRPADLAGVTLDFVRAGATAFTMQRGALAFDPETGPLRRTFSSWSNERVALTKFMFPFGSASHSAVYVAANKGIYFAPPPEDAANQFGPLEALTGRVPLIAPLLTTTKSYGVGSRSYEVFVKETASALTITWKSRFPAVWDEQVQAVLFSDGNVRFSYATLPQDSWGAVVVTTGSEGFHQRREPIVRVTDPADDTGADARARLTPQLNAMLDIVGFSVERVDSSDLVEYRITTRAALDRSLLPKNGFVDYYFRPGVKNLVSASRFFVRVYSDRYTVSTPSWPATTGSSAVRFEGETIVVSMLDEFLVADAADSSVDAYTYHNNGSGTFTFGDSIPITNVQRDAATLSAASDLTALPPGFRFDDRPAVEAFTLPTLNVTSVWNKLKSGAYLTDADADQVAIFQSFLTDLVLYAGGYSTVGNPGVDGVRAGLSSYGTATQRRPALLHLDKIGRGWNSTDLGSLHLMTHEFGHRWLYFFRIREGTADTNSLNPDGAHPKRGAHLPAAFNTVTATDASAMGGGYFTDQGASRFSTWEKSVNYGYSWHELYLMGLAAPEEVTAPWFYLNGEGLEESYYPTAGRTYTVTAKTDVVFQQILDSMGPRKPAFGASQTDFPTAFVIVERASRGVTAAEVAAFKKQYVDAFAAHFAAVTNGRGRIVEAAPTGKVRRRSARS
ncbi:MAG: hypothetical protein WA208_10105, partial [Thermoanaerobaculia bacterium]